MHLKVKHVNLNLVVGVYVRILGEIFKLLRGKNNELILYTYNSFLFK